MPRPANAAVGPRAAQRPPAVRRGLPSPEINCAVRAGGRTPAAGGYTGCEAAEHSSLRNCEAGRTCVPHLAPSGLSRIRWLSTLSWWKLTHAQRVTLSSGSTASSLDATGRGRLLRSTSACSTRKKAQGASYDCCEDAHAHPGDLRDRMSKSQKCAYTAENCFCNNC